MKILWVKADKLLPVNNGGNIRSYYLLRHLASNNDVTFFSYYGGTADPQYERDLQSELPGSVALFTEKKELRGARRMLDYAFHLPGDAPYAVDRFRCKAVQERLWASLKEGTFDVAVCDFLDAAINFPEHLDIPCVLFQHNVESEIWRRHALTEGNPVRKRMYELEFRKMLAYERETVRKFHHVIAVSEHDKRLMSQWVDEARITVVPTGVDLQQFQSVQPQAVHSPVVTFIGAMDWEPNVDAVEYFCSEIWPSVLNHVPDARFKIVGRNPDERVRRLASASVEVTGSVPTVLDYLRESAVVVVPLRIGGGTRLKIYEAMAAGKAVVSTAVGAEGLDVHDGIDILLADDPASFADKVLHLLRQKETRSKFERAAAALAARYDWRATAGQFGQVLQDATGATATCVTSGEI